MEKWGQEQHALLLQRMSIDCLQCFSRVLTLASTWVFGYDILSASLLCTFYSKVLRYDDKKMQSPPPPLSIRNDMSWIIISGKVVILLPHSHILSQWEDLYLLLSIDLGSGKVWHQCAYFFSWGQYSLMFVIHLFNKYWSRAYFVPETTGDAAVNKTDKVFAHMRF